MPKLKKRPGETKKANTVRTAMTEFRDKGLHSGSKSGPLVKNRKQAIAIGLSQARAEGADTSVPPKEKGKAAATAKAHKDSQRKKRNIGRGA